MKVIPTELSEVLIIEPRVFHDARGYFLETWNRPRYESHGIPAELVQDNVSYSKRGVLRGLHYQYPHPQGKLVCALAGEILDVAVDIRVGSPTFGRWVAVQLSATNVRQLYIPEGFAHGFCVLSDEAVMTYKCTDVYRAEADASVRWDDPTFSIAWPVTDPILSDKDRMAPLLADIPRERLPHYAERSQTLVG